jgi:hypothetical protein
VPPRLFWYSQVLPTPMGQFAYPVVDPDEPVVDVDVEPPPAAALVADPPDGCVEPGEPREPDAEPGEEPQPARTSPAAASASAGPAARRA